MPVPVLGQERPIEAVRGHQGMVAAANPLAAKVGAEVLQRGGNAVDAAVATAMIISVVEPFSAGLGGGGFLVLRLEQGNQILALDFREIAPLAASRNMYLDAQGKPRPRASVDGHLAVAVPGTVAGLYEAQRRYGKLSWAEVVAPAIHTAEQGFPVGSRFIQFWQGRQAALKQNPAAAAIFGRSWQQGDRLLQPDLGKTLRSIAENPHSFYRGWIADAIVQDMAAHGGLIQQRDLTTYRPTWRKPLCGQFRQYQLCSMPPPSSGGVHLLQMLNMVGETDLNQMGRQSPDSLALLASVMQIAYADRAVYLGDPAFTQVPVAALVNPAYSQLRRQEINLQRARSADQVRAADPAVLSRFQRSESLNTSHLTVVDAQRNAVSLTFTVNGPFGAAVVTPGTGLILNNEMDDFAVAPGIPNLSGLVAGEANAVAPGKIPLSSMTPLIVTKQGRLRLALGATGGSTIITTVFQLVLNTLVYRLDPVAAITTPRIHQQWQPDRVLVQQNGFAPETLAELQRRGFPVELRQGWGNSNLIVVDANNQLTGVADPRGEGGAAGF